MKFIVDLRGEITKEIVANDESDAREKFKEILDLSEVLMKCPPPTVADALIVHDGGQTAQAVFKTGGND
jgi:hypothetical protein